MHFISGSSDKLYVVQIHEHETPSGTEFSVVGFYGRRGGSLRSTQKYKGSSKSLAEADARKLIDSKLKTGYEVIPSSSVTGMPSSAPIFGGTSVTHSGAASATPVKAVTGPIPMLAESVKDDDHTLELIEDSNWGMQRKYDGERVVVSVSRKGIQAYNRRGQARSISTEVEAELKKLLALPDFQDDKETVLDGELMGDVFVAFNILTLRDSDIRSFSFDERYTAMEELLKDHSGLLAPLAWSVDDKRSMLESAINEDWEGVMFINLDSPYTSNRSSSLLKNKLWATCTCRVLTVNTRRSIQIALLDEDGMEQFAGNVTVPVNQDIPEPDDLVEVRYLYALDEGSLFQPTLIRVRTDVEDADPRSTIRQAPPEKRGESLAELIHDSIE